MNQRAEDQYSRGLETDCCGGTVQCKVAQRRAAFIGIRNKRVCKGMRSDTEEGVVKECNARTTIPKVLQMVWASSRR